MPGDIVAPRYAFIRDAAKSHGIAYRTLLSWIAKGDIQGYRFGRRMLQVDLNELDSLRVPVEPRKAS